MSVVSAIRAVRLNSTRQLQLSLIIIYSFVSLCPKYSSFETRVNENILWYFEARRRRGG